MPPKGRGYKSYRERVDDLTNDLGLLYSCGGEPWEIHILGTEIKEIRQGNEAHIRVWKRVYDRLKNELPPIVDYSEISHILQMFSDK